MLEGVEIDQVSGFVEANQVAHPAEHGDVGDGVVVVHDPLAAVQAALHHAQQALGLGDVALQRPFVLVLPAGEFVEEAHLAEHRPHRRHLEEHPGDGLVAPRRVGWDQPAGLVGQVEQDGAGLEQAERLPARPIGIDDRRDLAVGVQGREFGAGSPGLAEGDGVRLIGQPQLFQRDGDLHSVGRGDGVELQAVGVLGRPAIGDREGGEIGHVVLLGLLAVNGALEDVKPPLTIRMAGEPVHPFSRQRPRTL